MPLEILTLTLGPMGNNTYLLADQESRAAVVVDPSFDSEQVLAAAKEAGWRLEQVWLTHAHFDHTAGVAAVAQTFDPPLPVGLHPADLPLWQSGGGGRRFGLAVEPGFTPALSFTAGQRLRLGEHEVEVRHTPGHTPGHVVFYAPEAGALLCGDVIFQGSIGRTDLPGGDYETLMESIRAQILTLPDATRLLPGHGPETTVALERLTNPFLV